LIGTLSVLVLMDHAARIGWLPVFSAILAYYTQVKNLVLTPVAKIAHVLVALAADIFSVDLGLHEYWSDVFVLMTLYLGSRALSYWRAGLRRRAIFRVVWSFAVGLLTGIVVGLLSPESGWDNLMMFELILVGLTVFELVDASWAATFHRKQALSWISDVTRYLAFSWPSLGLGLVLLTVFWANYDYFSAEWIVLPGIVFFLAYLVVLAAYWITRGLISSRASQKQGTGLEKFLASSNTQIGLLILRSLGGAAILILFNAGLSLASV
jgi:hypothetical protein